MNTRTYRLLVLLTVCIGNLYCDSLDRVTDGVAARQSSYPFIVGIFEEKEFLCGGSLIRLDTVLTAAHCFKNNDAEYIIDYFRVAAGSRRREHYKLWRSFKEVYVHPLYRNPLKVSNDIAIGFLNEMYLESKEIKPIMLPPREYVWPAGKLARVVGWGITEYETLATSLRHTFLHLIRWSLCQKLEEKLGNTIDETMECAGEYYGGRDSCRGDSGGPLVYEHFLIGIVSFGPKACGSPANPGVYAKVSYFVPWIWNHVEKPNYVKDRKHFYEAHEIIDEKIHEN